MKRSDLAWGVLFVVVWMGKFGMVPLPQKAIYGIGAVLIFGAHVRGKLYTFLKVGIGLAFLGNEQLMFAYCISLLPTLLLLKARPGFLISRPQRWIFVLLTWCFFSYVVSQYIEFNPGAFWFYLLTFGCPMVLFPVAVQAGGQGAEIRSLTRFLLVCVLWQSILIAYHAIVHQWYLIPGDWATGAARQPSISFLFGGCLLFLVAISLQKRISWDYFFFLKHRWVRFGLIVWLIVMQEWTHTRVLHYSILIALAIGLPLLLLFKDLRPFMRCRQMILGGVAVGSLVCILVYQLVTVPSTSFGESYMVYIQRPYYNHKYVFLTRALGEIPDEFYSWLTGTGPGTVGSRAANSRAYDTLFKLYGSQLPSFIPPFTSLPAKRHFVDLYQEGFVHHGYKSVTLAAPFSSLISLFVELGLIGFIFFLSLAGALMVSFVRLAIRDPDPFYKTLGITLYLSTIVILVSSFFDTFLERPLLMGPYWMMAGLAVGKLRSLRRTLPNVS